MEQKNTLKLVSTVLRESQAETVAMNLETNSKLLDMDVKQRNLKRSHASALLDKNATIATVKKASRETVEREANLKKDVRVAMKNANSNKKLAEDRNKKSYDMARHIQYLKDEPEDSRERVNCIQVEFVNLQGLKWSVELRSGNLDRELLDIKVEMKVQIRLSSVSD